MIKRYLKEPLFHFLVLGGLIFYAYSFFNNGFESEDKKITIQQIQINQLTYIWKKKFLREPSKEEIQELIDKAIYAQVMYREALKLGLEQNDPVIERRLVQKMEFLSENFIQKVEPTEEDLRVFMQKNRDIFLEPMRISFHFKNAVMGKKEYTNLSPYAVSRLFGRKFTKKLFTLKVNVWHENILCAYGKHALYIKKIVDAKLPNLSKIKSRVKEAYISKKETELKREFYKDLKEKYTIEIGK